MKNPALEHLARAYLESLPPGWLETQREGFAEALKNIVLPEVENGLIFEREHVNVAEGLLDFSHALEHPLNRALRHVQTDVLSTISASAYLERKYREHANEVFLGVAPGGEVHGRVKRVTEKQYMILVSEGIMLCLHYLAKLGVALILPAEDAPTLPDEPASRLKRLQELAHEYFLEYAEHRTQVSDRRLFLSQRAMEIVGRIVGYAERFLVAHEFGHITLGHFDAQVIGDEDMCRREVEADAVAAAVLFADYLGRDLALEEEAEIEEMIAGVMLFFIVGDAIERILLIRSAAYPPAADRLGGVIDAVVKKSFEPQLGLASALAMSLTKILRHIDRVPRIMKWQEIKTVIMRCDPGSLPPPIARRVEMLKMIEASGTELRIGHTIEAELMELLELW